MTIRAEQDAVKADRDTWDTRLRAGGHDPAWTLHPDAARKGGSYLWEAVCRRCGAGMAVDPAGATSHGDRDARQCPCDTGRPLDASSLGGEGVAELAARTPGSTLAAVRRKTAELQATEETP